MGCGWVHGSMTPLRNQPKGKREGGQARQGVVGRTVDGQTPHTRTVTWVSDRTTRPWYSPITLSSSVLVILGFSSTVCPASFRIWTQTGSTPSTGGRPGAEVQTVQLGIDKNRGGQHDS